jgi:cell division septation protein DedD
MTTKISAIIAQQIASQTRLIIPEVGTLIRRKESGEIVFMEMLRKSDGVLAGVVVQTLDVSPSKANELLNQYAATIKQQLATNKKFILDGVGILFARNDGGVDFSFNPFAQSLPEPERGIEIHEDEFATPEPVRPAVVKPAPVKVEAPKPTTTEKPTEPVRPTVAPKPTPKPAPQPEKKTILLSDEAKQSAANTAPKKKIDIITIIAFVALGLALLSLIWGAIPARDRVELELEPIEQVAE